MNYESKYLKYKNKYIELKRQVGGEIKDRAIYEYNIYKYCNEKLTMSVKNNTHIFEYIKDMCYKTIYYFIIELYNANKIDEFVTLYNNKTKTILSGAIVIENIVDNIINSINKHDDNKIFKYMNNNLNIRSSMTLLDIILKFILNKSNSIKNISDRFDNDIRKRNQHTISDTLRNRDELCLTNFYVPNRSGKIKVNLVKKTETLEQHKEKIIDKLKKNNSPHKSRKDRRKDREELKKNNSPHKSRKDNEELKKNNSPEKFNIRNKSPKPIYKHQCLNMVKLLEPYTLLEQKKYDNDQIKKFDVGSNIFTAPNQNLTIDVFAAGFSGHTFDILLLMTIFVFNNPKRENVFLVVYTCLIWMLNYYHHSLREIFAIAYIFIDNIDNTHELLELFTLIDNNNNGNDNYQDKIDNIFKILEDEIKPFNNSKYTSDYPMVNNNTLFKVFLENTTNSEEQIKLRINNIKINDNINNFLTKINSNIKI